VFVIARVSYGTRMTNSGLIQIHAELEESAQMSGATTWQGFRRISVPLLAPTLLYAWLWIALLVFRELTLAVILSTADNLTFPVVVWSLWLGGGLGQEPLDQLEQRQLGVQQRHDVGGALLHEAMARRVQVENRRVVGVRRHAVAREQRL